MNATCIVGEEMGELLGCKEAKVKIHHVRLKMLQDGCSSWDGLVLR